MNTFKGASQIFGLQAKTDPYKMVKIEMIARNYQHTFFLAKPFGKISEIYIQLRIACPIPRSFEKEILKSTEIC